MASGVSPAKALVLFGPPGSGKGTQAKMLTHSLQFPHISTGDMLREHIKAGDPVGLKVRDLLKAGQLVSDDLVDQMVAERITRPDCQKGFILDGYPRTLPQAESVTSLLAAHGVTAVVVYLRVDEEKLVKRLTNRRQCPQCGTLYNVLLKPPIVPGRCDVEGSRLTTREDDREDVIRQRFESFERQTRPVLDFFNRRTQFLEVAASDSSPEQILHQIEAFLATPEAV
ncbi:MAG: adenylate kinase [Acidobacteria bacterium]|nr:adenylate kinase [Acidobacteriota bacterium]